MSTPLTRYGLSGSQTVGPFFAICLTWPGRPSSLKNVLTVPSSEKRIRLEGRVVDGAGDPIPDAMVEIWQANEHGRYNHPSDTRPLPLDPAFTGFGRSETDDQGCYWFETVKPGPVPYIDGRQQAPHIVVTVFSRGLLNHAVTRLYFEDDPATASDPILQTVGSDRRGTLIATKSERGGQTTYTLDLVMQGNGETVFFNV